MYIALSEIAGLVAGKLAADELAAWDECVDKEALLYTVELEFDSLAWLGVKASKMQESAFPRIYRKESFNLPEAVRLAVALETVSRASVPTEASQLQRLATAGLKSYSLADFSVSFADGSSLLKAKALLVSGLAYTLIAPYLLDLSSRGEVPIR